MTRLTDEILKMIEEDLTSEDAESLPAIFSALASEIVDRAMMKECVQQLKVDSSGDFEELAEWFAQMADREEQEYEDIVEEKD